MIIYCGNFYFEKPNSIDSILNVVLDWVNQKSGLVLNSTVLAGGEKHFRNKGISVNTLINDFDGSILGFSIRLTHGDSNVNGRQWVVEIGCKYEADAIHTSVLLETKELSTRVYSIPKPSVPNVARLLVSRFKLTEHSPGKKVIIIDDSQKTYLNYILSDTNRNYPLILISPKDGFYAFDYNKLANLLIGVAEVLVIKPGTDTFAISDLVTDRYSAWGGAINIIYPPKDGAINNYIVYPGQIDLFKEHKIEICNELFSLVTHKTNFVNLRKHISSFEIKEQIYKQRLDSLTKLDMSSEADRKIWEQLMNEEIEAKTTRIEDLNGKLTECESLLQEADDLSNKYKYELDQLKDQINSLKTNQQSNHDEDTLRRIYLKAVEGKTTPAKILELLALCYQDKLVVLENALKTAKESESFRDIIKLSDLLFLLITDYRDTLLAGNPDSEAKKIFGNAYSAKESETTMQNKEARSMREFLYGGQKILMEKHLRIGVKDSPVETIRVHFHWDIEEKKIVVGYCGPHLKLIGK